ncbi:MAG: beta-glucosidase BglX [Alsobacter sp.]
MTSPARLLPMLLCAALALAGPAQAASERVEGLVARMTLAEKIGQLNVVSGHHAVTGPYARSDVQQAILAGEAGGLFNVYGAEYTRGLQALATTRTRLGIPLLLGFDALHGYRTIFPIPLGQAASWDLDAIREADRITAREAAAAGVNWIFAPMVDVSRDPRWGRVAEGAGESAWLGARIAAARVEGLQGKSLSARDSVAGCVKHFAGNGATEAGRDYSASDLSERALRETQLPPFQAAVAAGAKCVMSAFNAVDGVPGVANERLLRGVLRRDWGFNGVVVSDFGAVEELTVHGVAEDPRDAARQAFRAGTDMDMESRNYVNGLPGLVKDGLVPMAELDDAVRRILTLKEQMGLFDDPYARSDPSREKVEIFKQANREASLRLAEKSMVLLKNDKGTLPLPQGLARIAVIGPLGDSGADTLGPWAADGSPDDAITLVEGLRQVAGPGTEVLAHPGGTIFGSPPGEIAAALKVAKQADAVVLALGERSTQSGEAASRSSIDLPGDQMALARAVLALGKPTAVVLFNGRPLAIEDLHKEAPAILEAWFPGSMGGLAAARLLTGKAEPHGRLAMTFPRSVGQIPIYHDGRPTGRPAGDTPKPYTSSYIDKEPSPLYPFGYGLSYTDFVYGPPRLDRSRMGQGEPVAVSVDVMNTGAREGSALVQLYIHHKVARISRPSKELRGFARVTLGPKEVGTVHMTLTEQDLAFWQPDGRFAPPEGGVIEVMTGPNAAELRQTSFSYVPTLKSAGAPASP